jgi:hypothetical protein
MSLYNLKKGHAIDWIEQEFVYTDFTDGAGAAGTLVLDEPVPVGAFVLQTVLTGLVGFTGDTSAVITVGDGTDVDRYNTGTPDVFTTANQIVMGVPSGVQEHAAAKNVTVTVTAATDWGDVDGGAGTIRIYYLVGG